ncbi:MAG: alpha-amylase family glycosyl hydrolase [Desulfuromonadales bacterium]|nr:alpha-amylase family glycosyl hydrolase [Desulfuromonadales bacterium]
MNHRRLLLNREAVASLRAAGLADLTDRPLRLIDARRFGLFSGTDGTGCYLWSLLLAALRQTIERYLRQLEPHVGLSELAVAGQKHTPTSLARLWPPLRHHYPRTDLPGKPDTVGPAGEQARQILLAELFLLSVQLDNPAVVPWRPLFDDRQLQSEFDYRPLLDELDRLLHTPTAPGPWQQRLGELLRQPLRAAPHSLSGQLAFVREHWGAWLPAELLAEVDLARAVAAEEATPRGGGGPGPATAADLSLGDDAPAAFSADSDWMASCVLLAKTIYVWLDQLSRRYDRPLTLLSDIPEEELARLAGYGFNALWLIGIWERSPASRRIKQLSGNPEAEASAYALRAYRVAADLGGEAALDSLAERCRSHGIRLACDVVPNHTGIDSDWLLEQPDWFLQSDAPPYPGYRFSGPDLSDRPGISLRIEDGYWDHSDAAVVFEHHDHGSGRRRYIYHGNDGTHMPWNDTAQLNFLLPEVRQAMSDLIVATARRFRLIRFDAAMTLARKHYRRLWFPPPGGSAGVPSRSLHWLSDSDFNRAFPHEFWREVVDRIQREVPDTLLIAEAFWLMESYFVRTLGMHRVYNSAFMNMLKREENGKYRRILKETLAFNPEILKRYVNFMNNPDEATAVAQFGKGDKYFAVAVLLATLPGLPMFGHGQIEGLEEKYGMEYRRAYRDEQPDQGFSDHHQRTVFPLLRRRALFAGVDDFVLYDLQTGDGVAESLYAFSNGPAGNRHLVLVNNSAQPVRGRVDQAVPKAIAGAEGEAQPPAPFAVQFGLAESAAPFCRFRDLCRNEEYLRRCEELRHGLDWSLAGYQATVLCDFRLLDDPDGAWGRLADELHGRPVARLDQALLRLRHAPLWSALAELLEPNRLLVLEATLGQTPLVAPGAKAGEQLAAETVALAAAIAAATGQSAPAADATERLFDRLTGFGAWLESLDAYGLPGELLGELWLGRSDTAGLGVPLLSWALLDLLAATVAQPLPPAELLGRFGLDLAWQEHAVASDRRRDLLLGRLLLAAAESTPPPALDDAALAGLMSAPDAAELLGINRSQGVVWFNREGMTALCGALALQASWLALAADPAATGTKASSDAILASLRRRLARAAAVGYRLDNFLALQ